MLHIKEENAKLKSDNELLLSKLESIKLKSQNYDLIVENNRLKEEIRILNDKLDSQKNKIHNYQKIILSDDEIKFRDNPVPIKINAFHTEQYFIKSTYLFHYEEDNPLNYRLASVRKNGQILNNIHGHKECYEQIIKKLKKYYPSIKDYIFVPRYFNNIVIQGACGMIVSKNELFNDFPVLQRFEKLLHPFHVHDECKFYTFNDVCKYDAYLKLDDNNDCWDVVKKLLSGNCCRWNYSDNLIGDTNLSYIMNKYVIDKYLDEI